MESICARPSLSHLPVDWLRILVPLARREPFSIPPGLSQIEAESLFEPLIAHVDVHMAQGNFEAAGELLRLAFLLIEHDPERCYRLERKKIRWLESSGKPHEAFEQLRLLTEKHNRGRRNPHRTAELVMEQGILLDRLGQKAEALKRFRNAVQRYKRLEHPYNLSAALFNTASVLCDLGRHDDSLKVCLRALDEGARKHLDLKTHIALQLANCHESKQEEPKSQEYYHTAAQGYEKLGNRKNQSDILYRLGWMALRRSQLREAATLLLRALELKRELDYGAGLALYHFHRAEACRSVGLNKKALGHYRTSLSLACQSGQDGLCTQARFGLFRCCGSLNLNLPGILTLPPPPGAESILAQGRAGLYSNHISEGYRTYRYQETGVSKPSHGDRAPLARLIKDLARVQRVLGFPAHESLSEQSQAVALWSQEQLKK